MLRLMVSFTLLMNRELKATYLIDTLSGFSDITGKLIINKLYFVDLVYLKNTMQGQYFQTERIQHHQVTE